MGVYAPPPTLTRPVKGIIGGAMIVVIIVLGLAFDPVIYAIISNG